MKTLIIVGAFPPADSHVVGGMITDCKILIDSNLLNRFNIIQFDSTQISNPPPGFFVRAFLSIGKIVRFTRVANRNRGSIVLLFAGAGFSVIEKLFMCCIAKRFACKSVMYPIGGPLSQQFELSKLHKFTFRLFFQFPDIIFCQSSVWVEFFRDKVRLPAKKLKIMPSWTATTDLISIGEERLKGSVNGTQDYHDNYRIIFVGWLESYKGVHELAAAFALFLKKFPTARLVFIGDGLEKEKLGSYFRRANILGSGEFPGWLNRPQLLEEYRRADIFVLPSYSEGIPNSMIEAMAAGLPCILTNVGCILDYVAHKKHAYIISPKVVEDIYGGLMFFANNNDQAKIIARNGQLLVLRHFSPSIVIGDMGNFFEGLALDSEHYLGGTH